MGSMSGRGTSRIDAENIFLVSKNAERRK